MAYASVVSLAQTLEELRTRIPGLFSDPTMKSLAGSLEYFKGFLDDSSKRSYHQEKVKVSVGKFRDALNEVESTIELKICEFHQKGSLSGYEKASEDLVGSLLPVVQKIELIRKELVLSLEPCTSHGHDIEPAEDHLETRESMLGSPSRSSFTTNMEHDVVGLGDDLEKILEKLLRSSSERQVVAITGMGGIGKTTLAKKAYDHPRVRSRFDIHAWVTVSRDYGMRRLLLSLVRCIPGMTDKFLEKTEDQLAELLYRKLKNRRYLIVIDDIWSTEVWDNVTRCFPDDDNGSRIILTSRLNDVAAYANPDSPLHEMEVLSLDDSWKLLSIKVFGANDLCPSELEDIGKQIAEKCGGLPLAILVVAGHLSKIARRRESWIIVAKTVSSVVANDPDKCLGVLGMSYNYLPNHLKPCFLSMGAFPEDFEIKARMLIQVWVAEGFLKAGRLKSLEKVAEECLEDLISRNLIMIRKRRFNGEIRSCGLHDLLRDLSLREARKDKFLHVTSTRYVSSFLAQRTEVRGFSFLSDISLNDSSELSPHVARSMFLWGKQLISAPLHRQISLLASFKLIRVLAVFSHLFPSFPVEIMQLIHLRYLWIRSNGNLPASVSRLYNLQTLVFQQPELHYMYKTLILPQEIWNMTQLRRLRLLSGNYLSKPKRSAKTDGVLGLRALEELSHLCFASCTEEVFSCLPNIRKLSILDAASDDAFECLQNLAHLEKLETLKG
ncbi:putative late blight resistance protein homolog R1B-12 [Lycium ferocissimum]|uniref:putative late blight resistance protein homolog R1B-12 n=1 Tax=Lycium ferocissimum TaxID=112874 RepID=UPI0028156AE8|nr:putative late blight resistance protein homolog R1B-12 [Lycium ferocissimum]